MAANNLYSEQFRTLVFAEWEFRLRENPLFATMAGDHRMMIVCRVQKKKISSASRPP
jgi:hypothetical protein